MQIDKINNFKNRVINIIENGRNKIYKTIDTTMVTTYWSIGKEIIEELQDGNDRAEYGKELIKELSIELKNKYGRGYSIRIYTK